MFGFIKKAVRSISKVPGLNIALAPVKAVTEGNLSALNPVNIAKSELTAVKGSAKLATQLMPIAKPLAGGLAFVFPPVGVPLVAGVAVADKVLHAYNSANPERKASAARIVDRTRVLAKSGDVGAQRAYSILSQRAAAQKTARQFRVARTGHVARVG